MIPKKIHLLGIGGAGMAALAELLLSMSVAVSGSDREKSNTVKRLQTKGIPIDLTEDTTLLSKADCCVYSAALSQSHPQLTFAKAHMPTFSRGEFMGTLSEHFATVAAVAGTHGKTTASAMLTYILRLDQKSPSFLIGGHYPPLGGNGKKEDSSLLICEACEFAGSFLHLKRDLGILLNIDNDHLECYGDMPHLCDAFTAFCTPCKQILVNGHNQNAMTATQNHPHRFCYGFENTMDFYADNLQNHNGFYSFDFHKKGTAPLPITLSIPGKHNIENALAAAGAACLLGASDESIQKGLEEFFGVERRFQILSRTNGITVADDYAHHPAEIETLLKSAQQMGFSKITAVFQPFTYSRTKALAKEFATALSHAHRVILAPVMGGREEKDPTVSSLLIAKHLKEVTLCNSLEECAKSALGKATKGELILTMGCGNVYRCAEKIRQLQRKNL
jgi:UDP-N-acetylmuramate--alanine ligase